MALIPLSFLLCSSGKGYQLTSNHTVNHLLYIDDIKLYAKNDNEFSSLVSVVNVFSEYICMLFGLSKCNCVSLHRGKLVVTIRIPFYLLGKQSNSYLQMEYIVI